MIAIDEKQNIDPDNKIERRINGCKVRLFFILEHNERTERLVIGNLMNVFDRKMQGLPCVQIQ
jgi:hypothetical protein